MTATSVVIIPIPKLPPAIAAGPAFGQMLGTVYAVLGGELGTIVSVLIVCTLGQEVLTKLRVQMSRSARDARTDIRRSSCFWLDWSRSSHW